MKLYGTITSERASKGQGGNESIVLTLQNEKKEVVCQMTYYELCGYPFLKLDGMADMTFVDFPKSIKGDEEAKGKRQKGEHVHQGEDCEMSDCVNCGKMVHRCTMSEDLLCEDCK